MIVEEIILTDLLDNFNVKVDLPENLLNIVLSSDFLKADLQKEKGKYIFSIDDVVLTITPKDKKDTVTNMVIRDGKILGGVIYSYNNIEYLN